MFLPIILGALTPISLAPVRSEGGPGQQHLESPHVTAPGTTDSTHLIATTLIEPGKADRRAAAAAHVGLGIALATAGQTEAAGAGGAPEGPRAGRREAGLALPHGPVGPRS